jgi:hypothetical protein
VVEVTETMGEYLKRKLKAAGSRDASISGILKESFSQCPRCREWTNRVDQIAVQVGDRVEFVCGEGCA